MYTFFKKKTVVICLTESLVFFCCWFPVRNWFVAKFRELILHSTKVWILKANAYPSYGVQVKMDAEITKLNDFCEKSLLGNLQEREIQHTETVWLCAVLGVDEKILRL